MNLKEIIVIIKGEINIRNGQLKTGGDQGKKLGETEKTATSDNLMAETKGSGIKIFNPIDFKEIRISSRSGVSTKTLSQRTIQTLSGMK